MKENQTNAKDEKRRLGKRLKVKRGDGAKAGGAQKPDVQTAKVVSTGTKDVRSVRTGKPVGRPRKASTEARAAQKTSGGLQIAPKTIWSQSDDIYQQDIETVNLTKWIVGFIVAVMSSALLLGFILGKLA